MKHLDSLTAQVVVLSNGPGGGVIAGPAHVLRAICAALGFRNACEKGTVYLTRPKMMALGFGETVGFLPEWHTLSRDEINGRIAAEFARRGN